MKEIKCPNCGTSFAIDESDYAELLSHIRTDEFEKELKSREQALVEKYNSQNIYNYTLFLMIIIQYLYNLLLLVPIDY